MTNEEAIEILKHEHDYAQLLSYVNEALKMAISALEKQIPKKPIYEDVGNVYGALKRTCANCGDVCLVSKDAKPYERYCRFCGNLLDDWSDTE